MTVRSPGPAASSLIVLAFGSVLFHLARTDLLLRYVRPATRPLVIVAAVAMVALSAAEVLLNSRAEARPNARARAGWLVLVPVLLLVSGAPPALTVTSADRVPAAPRPLGRVLPPLPTSGVVTLGLSDIVIRSAWDHGRSMRGHRLRVVGFVRDRVPHGFVLTRLAITCCAADAERNDLEVRTTAAVPPRGSWLEVTGRFTGMSRVLAYAPRLTADDLHAVAEPADPYE